LVLHELMQNISTKNTAKEKFFFIPDIFSLVNKK